MTSDYYLYSVILKDCPYSEAAHKLLDSYKNIKKEFTFITRSEMDNYKTDLITTFPQIYLKKYNNSSVKLIGGYTEFKNIVNNFENISNKINSINKNNIKNHLKNNLKNDLANSWSNISLFRLFELLNS